MPPQLSIHYNTLVFVKPIYMLIFGEYYPKTVNPRLDRTCHIKVKIA